MGEVAEWSKANDSKSFNRKLFVGSNPTLSVIHQFCMQTYGVIRSPIRLQSQDNSENIL